MFEKAILDSLLEGLADSVLYSVPLRPERLYPDDVVLRIPDDIIENEPDNDDNVVQVLREEVVGPVNQLALAKIISVHNVDAHTILAALLEFSILTGIEPKLIQHPTFL